jgi:hypothetical protein
VTLDSNTETFPLNQSIYLDFTHDTNIVAVLTAFGLTQFRGHLPPDRHPGAHNFTVSQMVPSGARLDIEVIKAPGTVKADRSGYVDGTSETKYVHLVLNVSFAASNHPIHIFSADNGLFSPSNERYPWAGVSPSATQVDWTAGANLMPF